MVEMGSISRRAPQVMSPANPMIDTLAGEPNSRIERLEINVGMFICIEL
jgi:hypothetical protein